MFKSSKTQRFRENMRVAAKQSKQRTLDSLPEAPKKRPAQLIESKQKKQTIITDISTVTKEDELALKIGFRMLPSRKFFSKITADLYFDAKKMNTLHISILSGPLAADNSEFASTLDMRGISAGSHAIKIEIYELWNSEEKLNCASKEVTIEYTPLRREDRLIEIPIVKHVAGADLTVISDSEKEVYRELEESMKKEEASKRDEW